MTLNQCIKQIEVQFIEGLVDKKYYYENNIIVLEYNIDYIKRMHWIFGTENYIKLMKTLFEIREQLPSSSKDRVKEILKRKAV